MLPAVNSKQTQDLIYIDTRTVSFAIHDTLSVKPGEKPLYMEDCDPEELTQKYMDVLYTKHNISQKHAYPNVLVMLPKTVREQWKQ